MKISHEDAIMIKILSVKKDMVYKGYSVNFFTRVVNQKIWKYRWSAEAARRVQLLSCNQAVADHVRFVSKRRRTAAAIWLKLITRHCRINGLRLQYILLLFFYKP